MVLALAGWAIVRGQARSPPAARLRGPCREAAAERCSSLVRLGRVPHRRRLVLLRDRLDPHAEPRARQLDAFLRADAERVHLRPRLRRTLDAPADRPHRGRRRATSASSCWSWAPLALAHAAGSTTPRSTSWPGRCSALHRTESGYAAFNIWPATRSRMVDDAAGHVLRRHDAAAHHAAAAARGAASAPSARCMPRTRWARSSACCSPCTW